MNTYGILDGVVVGLSVALLIIAVVVATHAYVWLAWATLLAGILVAAAMVLAAKRGHGMVDGVILRPWQRQLLLAVVLVELVGIAITPFYGPKVDLQVDSKALPAPVSTLVADACGRHEQDVGDLEQFAGSRHGTLRDALDKWAELRQSARVCDSLKDRLTAIGEKLGAWNAESNEPKIDVEKLKAELNALPPPAIESPPPRGDTPPDRSPFVPDFAYLPPALLPSPPPASPNGPTAVTVEEKRRLVLDALLALVSGGFSFGSTKITTTMILGETMQSADDHGKAVLQAMAASIPKDRPDRLAKFWLQLRMLANEPGTSEDQRLAIKSFLDGQGPVPFLCDWVLLSLKERIGDDVVARIRIDESRVNDVIKSASSDEWPKVYKDVQSCVFERDSNHYSAYQKALADLQSRRNIVDGE